MSCLNLYQSHDYSRALSEDSTKTYFSPFRRDYARVIHSASFRRLQGKTQIYPGFESDFFRNRLTHSLEVAQVAKSIAIMLNEKHNLNVDYDLVETAALCHDIGHPPFGHNGEKALNNKMNNLGGFEGNAQTLRLLAKTEKKIYTGKNPIVDGLDQRFGLNLTYRTLAAVLKYDVEIPNCHTSATNQPRKGYYASESKLVNEIKQHILFGYDPELLSRPFKTIECYIMDLADDIAYSTYDIEDAFKGGFLDPLSMISANSDLLAKVKDELAMKEDIIISIAEIKNIVKGIFSGFVDFNAPIEDIYKRSKSLANSGYLRTSLTSHLVNYCISNVQIEMNSKCPVLSRVYLPSDVRKQVEVLKRFVYISVISATKMNIVRYRGRDIIHLLFDVLSDSKKETTLLPEDIGELFYAYKETDNHERKRIISDFIASMTDRYAVELFSRFKSDNPQSIFKPI